MLNSLTESEPCDFFSFSYYKSRVLKQDIYNAQEFPRKTLQNICIRLHI